MPDIIRKWDDMLFQLVEFKSQYYHCDVPARSKLGRWVSNQRREYKKKMRGGHSWITDERIESRS